MVESFRPFHLLLPFPFCPLSISLPFLVQKQVFKNLGSDHLFFFIILSFRCRLLPE